MTNYEKLSNYEINVLVAKSRGLDVDKVNNSELGDLFRVNKDDVVLNLGGLVNYCLNINDAWPIILNNNIRLTPPSRGTNDSELWEVDGVLVDSNGDAYCFNSKHGNPLRAAMIVYLMMKDEVQNETNK